MSFLYIIQNPRPNTARPLSLVIILSAAILTSILAIAVDTSFYTSLRYQSVREPNKYLSFGKINPVITPLNSLIYNSSKDNLALHGLHPFYTHVLGSLPLLLGPAILLFHQLDFSPALPLLSAFPAIFLLSFIPHQEPRFLLPVVPLILASLHLPKSRAKTRLWLSCWIGFNAVLGLLMGLYHQGGVVPAQLWLGQKTGGPDLSMTEVMWWKTYSPPIWLLGGNETAIQTIDLMGMNSEEVLLQIKAPLHEINSAVVGLVAPCSATKLDVWRKEEDELIFEEVWTYRNHLNMDDLDIGTEGVLGTIRRVVGRRGLSIWKIRRK